MSSKVILLVALLCVSLSLSLVTAKRGRFLGATAQNDNPFAKQEDPRAITGDKLVNHACHGVGKYEKECLKLLFSSEKLDQGEAMDLALFTMRYLEGYALNLTAEIKKAAADPEIEPLFQAALAECMEQLIPLDDLVEDAVNAMLALANKDSQDFLEAAITSTDMCDSQIVSSIDEKDHSNQKSHNAQDLKMRNDFLKTMLLASINIVQVNYE